MMTTANQKPGKRDVHGVLLLDKPLTWSSNGVMQKARWCFHARKAGHTGVLDPMATGLLPICFGEATKFSSFLLDADKTYIAHIRFGQISTTLDTEGDIIAEKAVTFSRTELDAAVQNFIGEIEQTPPMYSALKYQGKSLYEYARQGIEIERKTRKITIYALNVLSFDGLTAVVEVRCSKGTYIRTLASDLGDVLGCGAHLAALRRTHTAGFDVSAAIDLAALEALAPEARLQRLLPVDSLVAHLPSVEVSPDESQRLLHGQPVSFSSNDAIMRPFRLYDRRTQVFLGLGELRTDGRLWPKRLVAVSPSVYTERG